MVRKYSARGPRRCSPLILIADTDTVTTAAIRTAGRRGSGVGRETIKSSNLTSISVGRVGQERSLELAASFD